MTLEPFHPGDHVEVNIAGLWPVAITDVLLDLEADGEWHPAVVTEVLPDRTYLVLVMPLVGEIALPPVPAERLRPRS